MKLYSVHDKRAQEYGAPMVLPTDAHAVRAFQEEVNRAQEGNMLNAYPEDFALHRIGEFNQDNGALEGRNEKLLEAIAAMRPAQQKGA